MSEETKKTAKSSKKATTARAPKSTVKAAAIKKTTRKKAADSAKTKVKAVRHVKNAGHIKKKTRTKAALENNEFGSTAKYVWYSPYKLRPVVDVIRGKDVPQALAWLTTYRNQRSLPVSKVLATAVANAKHLKNIEADDLFIKDVFVEEGPTHRYFKPGAQGRANPQRKRLCHISVTVKQKQ